MKCKRRAQKKKTMGTEITATGTSVCIESRQVVLFLCICISSKLTWVPNNNSSGFRPDCAVPAIPILALPEEYHEALVTQFSEFFIMVLYCLTYNRDKFYSASVFGFLLYGLCKFYKKELQIGILITIDRCQNLGCFMLGT